MWLQWIISEHYLKFDQKLWISILLTEIVFLTIVRNTLAS